jgi:hypothetical protein
MTLKWVFKVFTNFFHEFVYLAWCIHGSSSSCLFHSYNNNNIRDKQDNVKKCDEVGCLEGCSAVYTGASSSTFHTSSLRQGGSHHPEDSHLLTHRRENLRSYLINMMMIIKTRLS